MAGRYLSVYAPDAASLQATARPVIETAQTLGLSMALKSPRLVVLTDPDQQRMMIAHHGGLVLGALFRRSGALGAIERLDADTASRIVKTGGQSLIDDYWGGYLAFVLADGGAVHVLRDPMGAVACFHVQRGGCSFFVSDVGLALDAGLIDGRIDWAFVAHHLAYPGLRTARTGLVGVSELIAGTRRTFGPAGDVTACCWTPWSFARPDRRCDSQADAVERLGAEARRCVGAWASLSKSILLELSGGLDSSIVAACLRQVGAQVHSVTVTTPHLGADERAYAQAVADQIGSPLTVAALNPAEADVTAAWPARLARPGLNVLQRAVDQAVVGVARQVGADGFFGGAGGDSVFCYLDTAAPAADVLRVKGPGRAFARTVSDLAAMHQCTVWRAGRLALRKAYGAAPTAWRADRHFLSDAAPQPEAHPWFPGPGDSLPGAREQVASIMGLQSTSEGNARAMLGPVRHPLLSQPLVELCLSIPSWMWIAGGRNRAVAREAFAATLPATVLNRRTKGDFSGFDAEVFDRQRGVLRDRLLGGHLAARGLLDRPAVERFLAAPVRPRDHTFFRLFVAADVETWIDTWPGAAALSGR